MINRKNLICVVYSINLLFFSHLVVSGENKVNYLSNEQVTEYSTSQSVNKEKSELNMNTDNDLNKSGSWPEAFEPSEKIDADSVISFPVDI